MLAKAFQLSYLKIKLKNQIQIQILTRKNVL